MVAEAGCVKYYLHCGSSHVPGVDRDIHYQNQEELADDAGGKEKIQNWQKSQGFCSKQQISEKAVMDRKSAVKIVDKIELLCIIMYGQGELMCSAEREM